MFIQKPKLDPPRGVLKSGTDVDQSFRHERFHASEDLADHIEHFWIVEWDLRDKEPYRAETLPHPSVHITFDHEGNGRIGGPSTAKFSRVLVDKGGVLAVKFTPAGFYAFLRKPVSALADVTVPLSEVFGRTGTELTEQVSTRPSDQEGIALIERFVRSRLLEADANIPTLNSMVYATANDRDILKVEDLVKRYNISKRTLQRLFAKYIGVSPKWIIQRYRLHEAAEKLASGGPSSQADLAFELGYSDQAHFVRDFKALVGTSPAAYVRSLRRKRKPK